MGSFMLIDLTQREIDIINTGIWVAQVECQLPETDESQEIQKLLEKLGVNNGDK